ncbi:MAG: lipopolysaccharide biosynthesis protein [Paludibacteraceae bacterium]|nr:lipopolysaccharide biosynthesis protein [Paludibacteraceae bacterium]
MSSVKEDTLKGVKWTAIERFGAQGIHFLLGLIMARLLTPEDYGTVGLLAIFIAISQTFIDSGFSNALIRKPEHTEEDFCTALYFNIVVSILCYVVLFFMAPYVGDFFHMPILCSILRVQSITLVINSLMSVQVSKLTIALDFRGLAKRTLYTSVFAGLIGIYLAYIGWGVWSLVAQTVIASLSNLLFIWIYCRWIPRKGFSFQSFHYLFSYGSKLLASGLLHTVYTQLTPLIIGRYYTSKELGEYSRGSQLASYPADITTGILGKVTFPILAKLQNDAERLISVYRKYICITSMVIFFGCMLLCAVAKPLVNILLTEKWANCVIFLQLFCFGAMFDHISKLNLNLLQVIGRSDLFFRLEVIKKTISIAILLISVPYGVLAICISKIIYVQIAIFINTYYTGKLFNLGYLQQVRDFSGFLIKSIIACVPAFLLTYLHWADWLTIVVGVCSAVLIYWLILRSNKYWKEIESLIRKRYSFNLK